MTRPRILMTRFFHRWADDEGLTSKVLVRAVREVEDGLSDGDLGGGIIKKRASPTENWWRCVNCRGTCSHRLRSK